MILLTGGAGYIGSMVARLLLAQGEKVLVYDNLSTGHKDSIPAGAQFVFGDVLDGELLSRVMRDHKVTEVLHFAAKLVVSESVEKPLDYYEVNVVGGLRLIQACLKNNIRHLVFSSTAAVYGQPSEVPVRENSPLNPMNPYGASKAMMEKFLEDADHAHGLRSVRLRYFNVAGAALDGSHGQRSLNATHLVKVASEAAAGKRPGMKIYGENYETADGTCIRDYIHVEDLAQAHLKALDHLRKGGESLTLNCGDGRGASVREVITVMKKVSQRDFPVEVAQKRAGDPGSLVAESTEIRRRLNWTPQATDLETICRTAFEWEQRLAANPPAGRRVT